MKISDCRAFSPIKAARHLDTSFWKAGRPGEVGFREVVGTGDSTVVLPVVIKTTPHFQGQKDIYFSFIWRNLSQSFYLRPEKRDTINYKL